MKEQEAIESQVEDLYLKTPANLVLLPLGIAILFGPLILWATIQQEAYDFIWFPILGIVSLPLYAWWTAKPRVWVDDEGLGIPKSFWNHKRRNFSWSEIRNVETEVVGGFRDTVLFIHLHDQEKPLEMPFPHVGRKWTEEAVKRMKWHLSHSEQHGTQEPLQ